MNDVSKLFGKGLEWSYDEYGLKGAVGFVAVVGLVYYLVQDRFDELLDEGDELLDDVEVPS